MEEEARRRNEAEAELVKALEALREKLGQVERLYAIQKGGGSNPPSRSTDDQELIDDRETAVALADLFTRDLIEFQGEDEMRLTEAGLDYAWEIFHRHPASEMVALALMWERIRVTVEEEED